MSQINFKAKVGEQSFDVSGNVDDIIGHLKMQLEKQMQNLQTPIPAIFQRWIYQGRILNNDHLLSQSGLKEGHTVIVMRTNTPSAIPPRQSKLPEGISDIIDEEEIIKKISALDTSVSDTSVSTNVPLSSLSSLEVSSNAFDQAMLKIFQNSTAEVKSAINLLQKIAENIMNQPHEEKYRKISGENKSFREKLGRLIGCSEIMISLGFTLIDGDWILYPTASAWDNLVDCKNKLSKFALKLEKMEIDSSAQVRLLILQQLYQNLNAKVSFVFHENLLIMTESFRSLWSLKT